LLKKLRSTYYEFPREFWILVVGAFIDRLGGTLIFPFFALYITARFNVGMAQAGVLLGMFSLFGSIGNIIGGALTDKIGRRAMMLFGLILSAMSSIFMGLANDLSVFYGLVIFVGLLSSVGGPASQAMVADIVPEEKRAEAFGVLRVVVNLSWIIGPSIGGFIASRSYLWLFIGDAIASTITAAIIFTSIPETKPEPVEGEEERNLLQTLIDYRLVLKDKVFVAFVAVSMLMLLVYNQLYNTLSVYLRDVHGLQPQGYGLLMSINASAVVLLQFWVTRQVSKYAPLLMMALGAGLYMVGFTMYGLVAGFFLFTVAMLIITFGEMVVMPVSQALVANLAPIDKRGRYMAFFGLTWAIPATIGPGAAGYVLDNFNPNLVWYLGGIITALSVIGYLALHLTAGKQLEEKPTPAVAPASSSE